jgi:NADH dehydrogenase
MLRQLTPTFTGRAAGEELGRMQRILIVGAGFAGVWSALSAARLLAEPRLLHEYGHAAGTIEIMVVAPRASLDLRPRFYEADVAAMTRPVGPLFDAVGVKFVAGTVTAIDPEARMVTMTDGEGAPAALTYDRLILASGSRLARPRDCRTGGPWLQH